MSVFFNKNENSPIVSPNYFVPHVGWISNNGTPTLVEISDGDFNSKLSGSEIPDSNVSESEVYNIYHIPTDKVEVIRENDGQWGVFKLP